MNIDSIKRKLLVKYPFFGSVVANTKFVSEPLVPTVGTDGNNIYYNPSFLETLTMEEQTFIFAHEVCHIAFNHIYRSEGKDANLWNIATDSVVNALLNKDGLPIVEGGVDIPDAINYDAETMYDKLLEEKNKKQTENQNNDENKSNEQQNNTSSNSGSAEQSNTKSQSSNQSESENQNGQTDNQQQSNGQNNSNSSEMQQTNSNSENFEEQTDENTKEQPQQDVGHDTHSMWNKAVEKKHQDEQQTNSEDSKKSDDSKKKEKELINKLTELGEKEVFKENKIERERQLEELRKSLASKSHGYGTESIGELRKVNDIGVAKPLIDWRYVLKEAIKYDVDWSYQNAGIEDGIVTPYLEEQPRPETEIVLDTSGSIDEALLRNFLRECKNILRTSKVKVGCFDTKFYGFTEIKNSSDIDNLEFRGGGGTNFNAAINAFTRRVENKIIFTDGEAQMPNVPIDAIWIVFGGMKIKPVGGKVIYIDEEQLERLNSINKNRSK